MSGDALVETVAIVGVILFGLGLPVELGEAACYFPTVSNRRPMVPVKAGAASEVGFDVVVDTEEDSAGVQDPSLIAGRIASDIKCCTWPVGMNKQRTDLRRHRTA